MSFQAHSYGSVCYSETSVSYTAEVSLTKSYDFGNNATYAWYTPTALGYRLQAHGWLKPYHISGNPSRKLWVDNGFYNNGNPDAQAPQGPISDLWNADPSNPSFVAP